MRTLAFSEIAGACLENGVNAQVMRAGETGDSSLTSTVEPTNMFAAVNEAGRLLRKHRYMKLAERAFSEAVVNGVPPDDVTAQSFVRLVNDSVHPRTGGAAVTFTSELSGTYGTCGEAEPAFTATLAHLLTRKQHANPYVHAREVIVGTNEQPLFLRKGVGEQSALSLAPIAINGITYPGGSIVKYDLRRDRDRHYADPSQGPGTVPLGAYDSTPLAPNDMRVAPVDEIERINFLRLSAFAFPEGSRRARLFSRELTTYDLTKAETRLQWSITLGEITAVAQQEVERYKLGRAA